MRTSSLALVFVFAFTAGVLHGCGGSSGVKPTPTCVRNSECTGNLVCALGFCVQQCSSSKDCSNNQLCIKSDNGNACRAPEVAAGCVMNSDCTKFCNSTDDGGSADGSGSATDGGARGVCPIICGRDR